MATLGSKPTIKVKVSPTGGLAPTSSPVTLKNVIAPNRIDKLIDVDASGEANGATLVYQSNTDSYVVRRLQNGEIEGGLDVSANATSVDVLSYRPSTNTYTNKPILGTNNEVTVVANNDVIVVGLPDNVTITNNLIVGVSANVVGTLAVGSNVVANTTTIAVGNSTVNTTVNSTALYTSTNTGGPGTGIMLNQMNMFAFANTGGNAGNPTFRNAQANTQTVLRVLPNGSVNSDQYTTQTQFEFFAVDYYSNTTNWHNLRLLAQNDRFVIDTARGANTDPARPIVFDIGGTGSSNATNANYPAVLALSASGKVGVSTADPDATLTVNGTINVSSDMWIGGNLTVTGTTTYINTTQVNIGDNIIALNTDITGVPFQDVGFEVNRGTSANVSFLWNEANARWTLGNTYITGPSVSLLVGNTSQYTTITGNTITTTTLNLSNVVVSSTLTSNQITITGATGNGATIINDTGISSWNYTGKSFSIAGQETAGTGIHFKPDGTKMYIVGQTGDAVFEYNLGTAWDISTLAYSQSFSILAQDTSTSDLFFSPDGLKMYVLGDTVNGVLEYTLGTAWNVTTATYTQQFSTSSQETGPNGLYFKSDGTTFWVVGSGSDAVFEYTLSTPWNVSTATYSTRSFSIATQEGTSTGLSFSDDGLQMFVGGTTTDRIYQYTLSTPWNVTTATLVGSVTVAMLNANINGLYYNGTLGRVWITDSSADAVFELTTSVPGLKVNANTVAFSNTVRVANVLHVAANAYFQGGMVVYGTTTLGTTTLGTTTASTTTIGNTVLGTTTISTGNSVQNSFLSNVLTAVSLGIPGTVSTATATTGGTLAAATYYYRITALDANGLEGLGSTEVSRATTGSTSTVTLTFPPVPGAYSYRVYRSTTTGTYTAGYIAVPLTSLTVSATNYAYTDTGTALTVATLPTTTSARLFYANNTANAVGYFGPITIRAQSNVGILTLTPDATFAVNGTANIAGNTTIGGGTGTAWLQIGNTTVNTFANSSLIKIANSTAIANLSPLGLVVGSVTVNATTVVANGQIVAVNGLDGQVSIGGDTNGAIELGKLARGSAGSPYIDFHSSASSPDYDVRIQASGGNTTVGSGNLTISANVFNVPNTVITGTANASVGFNVGANVQLTTSQLSIGNSTVNTVITSSSISTNGFINVVSTANIGGAINARSTLTVNGALTVANTAALGNTTITGWANVSGNITASNIRTTGGVQIDGDLTVSGNTITIGVTNLNVTDNMIYLNEAETATVTSATSNGTAFIYTANNTFSAGMVVTVTGISPAGYNVTANTIVIANATHFTVANTTAPGAYVSGGSASSKSAVNPDLGFSGAYDDGTYRHAGFFRDATDGVFKVFDQYVPEPSGAFIDTSNNTFRIADFQANNTVLGTANVAGIGRIGVGSANYIQMAGAASGGAPYILANGSDTDVPLILTSKNAGSVLVKTVGGGPTQFAVSHTATAVNYLQASGAATSNAPVLEATGSDATVNMAFRTKGGADFLFDTSAAGNRQFRIAHTASAVNYVQATGSATGVGVKVSAQGSDSNIPIQIISKGTSAIFLDTGGGTQFKVVDTASAVNFIQVAGSATGTAVSMTAQGTDTNLAFNISSKGSGDVNLIGGSGGWVSLNPGSVRQVAVRYIASAVNYITMWGSSTGTNNVTISAAYATDASVDFNIAAKAAGAINLQTSGLSTGGTTQVKIADTASAVNYIQMTGATAGNRTSINLLGTDTNVGLNVLTKGSGEIILGGNGREVLVVSPQTSAAANFLQVLNGATGVAPIVKVSPFSVDANVDISYTTRGTGAHNFNTGATSALQVKIADVAGANRYLQLQGGVSGTSSPAIGAIGGTSFNIYSTGGANIDLWTNGLGTNRQLSVVHTASAVNYIQVTGSATGAGATISANGSDANVALNIAAKASANVNINSNTNFAANTLTFTGSAGSNTSIALRVLNDGVLSFEGGAGQLFSIANSLTGQIFAVNDISGIPSIEVYSNGQVNIAKFGGNVSIGTSTSSITVNGAVTFANAITTGGALNITAGANAITFTNATSNYVAWNSSGVAAPTVTTRSAGTKLVLYPSLGSLAVDYGLGVEGNHLWFSAGDTTNGFKWYANTTNIMTSNTTGLAINSGQLSVGANVIANTTALYVGNSTVNTVITQTTAAFNANATVTALYVAANGNVGVGNATPNYKLLVNGDPWFKPNETGALAIALNLGRFSDSNAPAFSFITDDATSDLLAVKSNRYNGYFHWKRNSGSGEVYAATLESTNSTRTIFDLYHTETDNTAKVRLSTGTDSYINSAANVGIGTSTPNAKLQVVGTANVSGNVAFGQDVAIAGNLTVSGTTTYINTTTLNVGDNIITLNADLTGATAPSENVGIEVNRGSSANAYLFWNESGSRWEANTGNSAVNELRIVSNTYTRSLSMSGGGIVDSWGSLATPGEFATFGVAAGVNKFRTNSRDYIIANTASDLAVFAANGNVGIGTMTPANKLAVNGTITVGNTTNDGGYIIRAYSTSATNMFNALYANNDTNYSTVAIQKSRGSGNDAQSGDGIARMLFIQTDSGGSGRVAAEIRVNAEAAQNTSSAPSYLSFWTTPTNAVSATERVRVASNGNIGINNTAPGDMLSVNGSVQFTNSTASVLYAAANGNVGIGHASPVYPIHVLRNANSAIAEIRVENANTGSSTQARFNMVTATAFSYALHSLTDGATPLYNIGTGAGVTGGIVINAANAALTLSANSVTSLKIFANNNISIGSNTTPGHKLVVSNNIAVFANSADANTSAGIAIDVQGPVIRIGDGLAGQVFANGIGVKLGDGGNYHYSIGQIGGRVVISDTSSDQNSLYPATRGDMISANTANVVITPNTTITGTLTHGGLVTTTGTGIDQIYTATPSITLNTTWQSTGVTATNLANGTYIVQLYANDVAAGGTSNNEYYSGIMSWFSADTNSTVIDEIPLHRAGVSGSNNSIFLATQRTATANTSDLILMMSSAANNSSASTYTLKFRRMI